MRPLWQAVMLLALPLAPARAQLRTPTALSHRTAPWERLGELGPAPPGIAQEPSPSASLWSIAASAVVPGAGQAMLGLDRFIPYLAVEAYAWLQYAAHSRDARRYRDDYQTLSSRVAREPYSAVRPTGDFAYYERMSHYAESGAYDLVAGPPLDPETDTTTHNGATWLLARRTYWVDPEVPPDTASIAWQRAIEFYARRAYGNLYRWSWRGAEFEYGEFKQLIRRANDSNRQSLTDLGVVLANHLLSTIDAYVTVRVRRGAEPGRGGGTGGWSFAGSIPLSHLRR